jgi:ribosomal protein L4
MSDLAIRTAASQSKHILQTHINDILRIGAGRGTSEVLQLLRNLQRDRQQLVEATHKRILIRLDDELSR